MNSKKLNYRRI